MDGFAVLAASSFLKEYMVILIEPNFIAIYIENFDDGKYKHIDLLYDKETYHFDVISFAKGLFKVRFYCYVVHQDYLSVKHV